MLFWPGLNLLIWCMQKSIAVVDWTTSTTAILFWSAICQFYVYIEMHVKVELSFWTEDVSTMHIDALLTRNLLVLCLQEWKSRMNFVSRQPVCYFLINLLIKLPFFPLCRVSELCRHECSPPQPDWILFGAHVKHITGIAAQKHCPVGLLDNFSSLHVLVANGNVKSCCSHLSNRSLSCC